MGIRFSRSLNRKSMKSTKDMKGPEWDQESVRPG